MTDLAYGFEIADDKTIWLEPYAQPAFGSFRWTNAAQYACESSAMAAGYEGVLGKNNRGG